MLIYYYHSIKKNSYDFNVIDIFNENNNNYSNFKPFYDAFNLFFQIIDKQEEKSILYQAIHQFNGKIKEDLIKNIKLYSGSIIPLIDMKFELIKNMNNFFFIKFDEDSNSYATYSLSSKIITIFPYTFINSDNDFKFSKRISSICLFLIFHEICGHLKTNMNNNKPIINSPGYYIDNNLNLIFTDFGINDSGYIFESILVVDIINVSSMISNPKSEDLFNIKYYIQENFDELKTKLKEFNPPIISNKNSLFVKYSDKTKPINVDIYKEKKYSEKNLEEKLPKEFIEKLKEVEKNLDKYNYNTLFPIFKVPKNMSKKEFNKLLKGNPVYEKLMKIYSNNDEKH